MNCGAGIDPDWYPVETESAYLNLLQPNLDIILSDFGMPEFSGTACTGFAETKGAGHPILFIPQHIVDDNDDQMQNQ